MSPTPMCHNVMSLTPICHKVMSMSPTSMCYNVMSPTPMCHNDLSPSPIFDIIYFFSPSLLHRRTSHNSPKYVLLTQRVV